MLLHAFLHAFNGWLAQERTSIAEPYWRIEPDPLRRRADTNQILIGVGAWGSRQQAVEHPGVCLNNKGLAERFGVAADPSTVTEMVLNPPPELAAHWRAVWGKGTDLGRRLGELTLVIEDASPDSVLALLFWLAVMNGVPVESFGQPEVARWVAAVRRWELTGMVADNPHTSWAALLAALSHSHFAPLPSETGRSYDFAGAWREALQFTTALLLQDIAPEAVPEMWELEAYRRAAALLRNEEQNYLRSLPRSTCLQLLVPMAGPEPRKDVLVDAYLTVETWPSGARKLFARLDRSHSPTQQGFAVMGVYRPDPRMAGAGDDMVVSVNPLTGINLLDLWRELERLENERWADQRPTGNARPIASYPAGTGYTQPWWDDHGRHTLLAAPRRLPDGRLGSRLTWPDVVNALWRVYSPLRRLRVEDALHAGSPIPIEACARKAYRHDDGDGTTKFLLGMCWLPNAALSGALFDLPSVQRYLAALIARQDEQQPIKVEDLPVPDEFNVLPLHGGFAILHDQGVLVFDDWRTERLRLPQLAEEFERVFQTLGTGRDVARALDALFEERTSGRKPRPTAAVLGDLATLRSRLTEAGYQYQPGSHWADVRAFRAALETRWCVGDAIKNLHTRVSQLEDAIRTASTLETQRLTYILSTIGLPFVISNSLTGFLKPWLVGSQLPPGPREVWAPTLFYFGVALILIALIHIALKRWLLSARKRRQKVARSA
ncbi:MAG: hypothetical protein HWD57_20455 [Candidatus Accumulibacter cognatus]|uniref:Uncharacterized protein n=1 Tax=Candidatus Accumulibacter cognatus TaxID=2954383 RepID=A0A7D5NF30_9PROT|nr:MAG: hypothetical protein HWD57_20455 [Candidatus Accumulibacter cognatus]